MNRETEEAKSFLRLVGYFIVFVGGSVVALFMAGLVLFDLLFFTNWFTWVMAVPLLLLSAWAAWGALKRLFRQ